MTISRRGLDRIIGSNIKRARLAHKMSLQDLSNQTGIPLEEIRKIENGSPCFASWLFILSNVLTRNIRDFFMER